MDIPLSSPTEYCPQDRTRHVEIRTKFPRAIYCPHCAQRLPTVSSSTSFTPISIDLTADSPSSKTNITAQNTYSRGNAMTIPSQRTRPRPDTYQNAMVQAVQNRQNSIAGTQGHKDPIVVELHASSGCAMAIMTISSTVSRPKYMIRCQS